MADEEFIDDSSSHALVPHPRRCSAMVSNRTHRCRKMAMRGQRVCGSHGGRAPQNIAAGKRNIATLHDPAIDGLYRALQSNDMPAVVRASVAVLAFLGYKPGELPPDQKPAAQRRANRSVEEIAAENDQIIRILRERDAKPPVVEAVVMLPEPEANETSTPEETV